MTITARDPYKLREHMQADIVMGEHVQLSRGQRGAVVGYIERSLGLKEFRYLIFSWLFRDKWTRLSSKDLSNGEWNALFQWVGYHQDADGAWQTDPRFLLESKLVLNQAIKDYYNTPVSERGNFELDGSEYIEIPVAYLDGYVTRITDEDGEDVEFPDGYGQKESMFPKQLVWDKDDDKFYPF